MKTNYIKGGMLFIVTTALTASAFAQQNDTMKRAFNMGRYNNSDVIDNSVPGKAREHISTNWKGRYYEILLVNNKMTGLYVEGEKIPAEKWGAYSKTIAAIREQVRKDRIQASKDQEQAWRDQRQAMLDEQQAKKDQEQAARDQEQAKRDQEQAQRDELQAKKEQEDAQRDQAQARLDQEQAGRDQEQARLDQAQARKDQEEARKDQALMKQLIADLLSDKIVPNEKSLHEMTLNSEEMTVNGTKQPDNVFQKYKEKYKRFAGGEFSFENSGNRHGIHMSRQSISQ